MLLIAIYSHTNCNTQCIFRQIEVGRAHIKSESGMNHSRLLSCDELLRVDLRHVRNEVEHFVGITPLVVIPGDELDEVVVQADAGPGVED